MKNIYLCTYSAQKFVKNQGVCSAGSALVFAVSEQEAVGRALDLARENLTNPYCNHQAFATQLDDDAILLIKNHIEQVEEEKWTS